MRALAFVAVTLLPACALYFGADDAAQPPELPPYEETGSDAGPDLPPAPSAYARCEDGRLFVTGGETSWNDMPPHGAGTPRGACAGECRSAIEPCVDGDCTAALAQVCAAPISQGPTCALKGTSCTGNATASCAQTTQCGQAVAGGDCTCNGATYECTTTAAAEVQAAIVGKWRGTVTTEWVAPYTISVWIYPDGTYWAECVDDPTGHCIPFYYGGDGPHPWRRITILSASSTLGASADIGMFLDGNIGAISSLEVTHSTLSFQLIAAWLSCSTPIEVELTRE